MCNKSFDSLYQYNMLKIVLFSQFRKYSLTLITRMIPQTSKLFTLQTNLQLSKH